jgi:hypothetical protein
MKCDIEAKQTFTVNLDMTGLSTIERALSFYAERAILPDGDPARDLSRQFTTMVLRLGRVNPDAPPAPKSLEGPGLPPASSEVPALTDADSEPVEGAPEAQEEADAPAEQVAVADPVEANPLEAELESMMGDAPEEGGA